MFFRGETQFDEQWLTSSQIAEVIEVILVAADGTA